MKFCRVSGAGEYFYGAGALFGIAMTGELCLLKTVTPLPYLQEQRPPHRLKHILPVVLNAPRQAHTFPRVSIQGCGQGCGSFVCKTGNMPNRKSFLTAAGLTGGSLLLPDELLAGAGEQSLLKRAAVNNSYWYMGHLLSVLLAAPDTGGRFGLLKITEIKGLEPPRHTHTRETETFVLLEGEIDFTVQGQTYPAKQGDSMFLPRNIEHSFKVVSPTAEVLVLLAPGGFEGYFIDMSTPAPALTQPPRPAEPPDLPRLIATASKYGILFPEHH